MTIKYDCNAQTMPLLVGRPTVIDGPAEMLQRVDKLLRTPAGEAEIYERSGYGLNLYERIAHTRNTAVLSADLTKELTDKLVNGADIFGVRDVNVHMTHRSLMIAFVLDTVYGNKDIEVHL